MHAYACRRMVAKRFQQVEHADARSPHAGPVSGAPPRCRLSMGPGEPAPRPWAGAGGKHGRPCSKPFADPFACNKKMLDAIANHAHCNALASTKRKLSIANATPGPLWALDFEKLAPLSCAVLVPVLHGRPA